MHLSLNQNKLTIDLDWYEQLFAFTLNKRLEVALDHIVRVSTEKPQSNWKEIRAPGTFLPGVIKAGTYYTGHGQEFWYVTASHQYLILELQNEPYKRMIFTLDRNEFWAEEIIRNQVINP
jgi:hypothetical protein